MRGRLRDEPPSLGDALADVPPWVRLAIGLFVSGTVGVYVPLCVVALFGIWQNNLTMWGFNLLSILLFSISNLWSRTLASVWWGAVVFSALLGGYWIVAIVRKDPPEYWMGYWYLFFTIFAGAALNAACFVWYAKQTGLSWRRRRAKVETA